MIIFKNKINNSSYQLYHNDSRYWVSDFIQNLKIDDTLKDKEGHDLVIKKIEVVPTIKLKSFWLFWYKISPDFTIQVTVEKIHNESSPIKSESFVVELPELIKRLKSFESFSSILEKVVEKRKNG